MSQETERKFLVCGEYKHLSIKNIRITQGYLSSVPERTVRVRIHDEKGYITIKGATNASGRSRYEWEKEIPLSEAKELLLLCEPGTIDKTRHHIPVGNHLYEIDEFYGENEGLILAEIELKTENETFEKPTWLGTEVTGDASYYNSMLSKKPYKKWRTH